MPAAFAAVLLAPVVVEAQQRDTAQARREAERRLGRDVSQEEIIERLRRSGMTRSQVRAQLQRMGYDPTLADRYFDLMERDMEAPPGYADDEFVDALRRMGVVGSDSARVQLPDSIRAQFTDSIRKSLPDSLAWLLGLDSIPPDSLLDEDGDTLRRDRVRKDSLRVFGKSLFERRRSTEFEPVTSGPVDPSYRVGPGDELNLILTGDVQLAYPLEVTREGIIVIPDVGQVPVAGLTLGQLEDVLYDRLGRVYSGVRRGPGASTRFQMSLGRLRTNQVFVVGDVERPGSYQVPSVSTVFHALHRAGGPSEVGSFRRIQVWRGSEVVREVDLYDYLLRGDSRSDVRLDNGDRIFVPPVGAQVRVEGAVRRPAIYETLPGDELRDVIRFAGGPSAAASLRTVKIDRILPPIERRAGLERVLMDVDVVELLRDDAAPIALHDGDRVHLFEVSDERRNVVVVQGQVNKPGSFHWRPGTTLWEVIERADGLAERAYTPRAHVYRLNEHDGTRRLVRTPLLADASGRPARDVALEDRDSVVVYSVERLRSPEMVAVEGFVKRPGKYALAEGMTVEDVVLAAGGFTEGAHQLHAEVARRSGIMERTDTTAHLVRVRLGGGPDGPPPPVRGGDNGAAGTDGNRAASLASATSGAGAASARRAADPPHWLPAADEFELVHGDRVYIRRAPGFEEPRVVVLTGEVMLPGEYVLETRTTRVTDLLARAGGLTREAYAPGFQLVRKGDLMATDLERALRDPDARGNVTLEDGDTLHVPRYDPTVRVTGAVGFTTRVLYRQGAGLDYYIDRAGGFARLADKRRVSVTYQDGERAVVRRRVLFSSKPEPGPGSTVHVPELAERREGLDWDTVISRTLTLVSTAATLYIAVNQVR